MQSHGLSSQTGRIRGRRGVLTGAVVAGACLVCMPATAFAGARQIHPSAVIAGQLVHSGEGAPASPSSARTVIPLRGAPPAVYAQAKRLAAARAAAEARRAGPATPRGTAFRSGLAAAVFGTLNAYQWLIYIPLHNLRHEKQIAEVKATKGYPK